MTSWVNIPNTDVDAESPFDVDLATAYRDNPIAITEGAVGAPKNQLASLAADIIPSVELLSATASSSPVTTSIDFTSSIDSTYNHYIFELEGIQPAADGDALYMRLSDDGGTTFYTTGVYDYHLMRSTEGASTYSGLAESAGIKITLADSIGTAAAEHVSGEIHMWLPGDATLGTHFYWHMAANNNSPFIRFAHGVASWDQSATIDAVRFYMSSGNIESGSIRLLGVR